METKDFVCVCLGISSQKIDEICDTFDLDIFEEDFIEVLSNTTKYDRVGNIIIRNLYDQVIEYALESYGKFLDEYKFEIYTNGMDSHLMYDREEIYNYQDIEDIVKEQIDEDYIQEWWSMLEFDELESITGLKSYNYPTEEGSQAFIDACNDWLAQHSFAEQQEICIDWYRNE